MILETLPGSVTLSVSVLKAAESQLTGALCAGVTTESPVTATASTRGRRGQLERYLRGVKEGKEDARGTF